MSARTPTRPATTFRAMLLLTAVAMAGVAARFARVPMLFPHTALVSSEGERYLFTSFPRFEGEAKERFRYLSSDRKLTRLAIAHDPNAYGLVFRDRLRAHATGFGYEVAGAVTRLADWSWKAWSVPVAR